MLQIKITDNAARQMNALLQAAPESAAGLRLTIKSTGCSGHSYKMEYVQAGEDLAGDDLISDNDAQLYIPKMHSWMLIGMTIDYVSDALGNAKFEFINPNEAGRCGCGESFQVDKTSRV